MLVRLALGNVRKSVRDYAIYFVTLVLGVAVFYAFNSIAGQASFLSPEYGEILGMLGDLMTGLTVFLALVLGFLMVYANNYLVRRRKKELGLYQVLGMRRGQVSIILTLETLMASLVSLLVGLLVGVLLSQVLVFVTAALFHEQITNFVLVFSGHSLVVTLLCFGVIFLVMLLLNLRSLGRVKLVDLMGAERTNESVKLRSLPLALLLFLVGCGLIGCAYWRLLHDGFPLSDVTGEGRTQFLITTVMVVVGTFLFFYAFSGFMLIAVQRFKGVYWRGLNMFTLRQLNSRINTTSLSMALISIILFLAITSVTGGMSICTTMNNSILDHTPSDATVNVVYVGDNAVTRAEGLEGQEVHGGQDFVALMAGAGYDLGALGDVIQVTQYSPETALATSDALTIHALCAALGAAIPAGMEQSLSDTSGLSMIPASEYNAYRAFLGLDPIEIGENGYLIISDMGGTLDSLFDAMLTQDYPLEIAGKTLLPATDATIHDLSASLAVSALGSNPGMLVVPDEVARAGVPCFSFINVNYAVPTEEGDAAVGDLYANFDSSTVFVENGQQIAFVSTAMTATDNWTQMAGMTGVISYLAVYIGFVLVIACAAILAIQQLSGTSDSQARYRLLSELGAPTRLIYRSLLAQTVVYFLFPLVVGIAHSLVALHVVIGLVSIFGHIDIAQSSVMTAVIFVVVYGGYMLVTYRVSRGIVRGSLVQSGGRHSFG